MTPPSHLSLIDITLASGAEWSRDPSVWCLLRLSEGHGYWLQKGAAREINTGEVLVIPPGISGSFRSSRLSQARLHYVFWHPELLTGVLSLVEQHFFSSARNCGNQAIRVVPASDPLSTQLEEHAVVGQGDISLVSRSHLLQVIGAAFRQEIGHLVNPHPKAIFACDRFEVLIAKLTDSEIVNFTPAELARRCGCSRRHFGRLFCARFGVSVRSHQTNLRLQKAGQLLANGDNKVIDVTKRQRPAQIADSPPGLGQIATSLD